MHLISVSNFLTGLIVNDDVKNRGLCSQQILLNCAAAFPVESNALFGWRKRSI